MVPHRRGNVGQSDAVYLGGNHRVKVVSLRERLAKSLILGKVRQHAEFDLRVIGREQHVIRRRDKSAPDLAARFAANRNVLQVGFD